MKQSRRIGVDERAESPRTGLWSADLPGEEPGGQPCPTNRVGQRPRRQPDTGATVFAGLFGAGVRAVHQRPLRARRPRAVRLRHLRRRPTATTIGASAALAVGGRRRRDRGGDRAGGVGVAAGDPHRHRQSGHTRDHHHVAPPPVQDEITTTTPPPPPPPPTTEEPPPPPPTETVTVHRAATPAAAATDGGAAAAAAGSERPPPPPPPTTTPAGPRQVTYSVTGTKAPGDIISVTYIDASGRSAPSATSTSRGR